jgi:glutathione peroxidase
MKYISGVLLLILLSSFQTADEIYNLSVKRINGETVSFNNYRGKKMLFIILPYSAQDTSASSNEIATLQAKYGDSLVIVGVPGIETGFESTHQTSLQQRFASNTGSNFILAEGMKVKKTSGEQQSALFQWLTKKDRNKHFDQDVLGTGHKFFVDESGELYAVLGPQTKLSKSIITRVLDKKRNP